MSKRVTSTDIARALGISQATVSYVLNRRADKSISDATSARIWQAAQEMGYQPNAAARALATGRTHQIAVWVPAVTRPVFGRSIEALLRQAENTGYRIVIEQINYNDDSLASQEQKISHTLIDGILAIDRSYAVDQLIALGRKQIPVVCLGPNYSEQTDYVGLDLYGASVLAAQHLVQIGCRRIAYLGVTYGAYQGDPHYDAYQSVMAAAGQEPSFLLVPHDLRSAARDKVMEVFSASSRLLPSGVYPDGLFCFNDELAVGANAALHALHIQVPTEVALIGSDGTEEMEYHSPPLSTVAQPVTEMCTLAWQFLQNRIADSSLPPQQTILPYELIVRASTAR